MEKASHHNFGKILKELRRNENLTQAAISRLLETDRSNIANYETGKRFPPLESLIKIAEYFKVSLDYLVLGKKTGVEGGEDEDPIKRELMAENTFLMENELKMHELLREKDEEIAVLKDMVKSLKAYNDYLEKKLDYEQELKEKGGDIG